MLGFDFRRIWRQLEPDARINRVLVAPGADCDSFVTQDHAQQFRARLGVPLAQIDFVSKQTDLPAVLTQMPLQLHWKPQQQQHTMVWLARPDGSQRSVQNSDETIAWIERYWEQIFGTHLHVIVHSDDTDAYKSRRDISRATLIAGPHGSGFANLVLARAGTMVLEIHPAIYQPNRPVQVCYFQLSANLDLLHRLVVAQTGEGYAGVMVVDETNIVAALYDLYAMHIRYSGVTEWKLS